jgi:hypothetical protein
MLVLYTSAVRCGLSKTAVILRGPMFIFVCIAGGLILASTVLALLVSSGSRVTLSDIALRMEKIGGSQQIGSGGARVAKKHTAKIPGQVKRLQ